MSNNYNYKFDSFDNLICTVTIRGLRLNIVNVYRPPSYSKPKFLIEFETLLCEFLERDEPVIFFGDFNINFLESSKIATNLQAILQKYDLKQMVTDPTRMSSLLDYAVISNSLSNVSKLISPITLFPSDHIPVFLQITIAGPNQINDSLETIEVTNFNHIDIELLKASISESDLTNNNIINSLTSNECVQLYNTTVKTIIDKLCPKRRRLGRYNGSKKWYNASLQELKRNKRKAERALKKSPKSTIKLSIYRKEKNCYTTALRQARTSYYAEQLRKFNGDSKNLYKVLNELSGNKKPNIFPTSEPENIIANKMSSFYVNKILNIRNEISLSSNNTNITMTNPNSNENNSSIFHTFREIDLSTLKKVISATKKKSNSLDPCPTNIIIQCIDLLYPLFLRIINDSILTSVFPDLLKNTVLRPLLKNPTGNIEDFKMYRPVCSLPFPAKLLERVVYEQLKDYLLSNNLLPYYQSSYREHYSCETALLRMTTDIQQLMYEGNNVMLIILDSSAAFDTIDQKLLLEKLEKNYNIKQDALKLLSSYFKNRHFSVKINNTIGAENLVEHGVPQGSLLGPLFYNLYTKKIENIVLSHNLYIQSYADDCQIYTPFTDQTQQEAENNLNNCLKAIELWMKNNFLKLNAEKTKIKIFRKKTSEAIQDLNILGKVTEEPIKVLGASLNNIFKFHNFVAHKVRICNLHLRNLYMIRNSLDTKTRILLVSNLILTTLDYCNILLLGCTDKDLKPLKLMINKAIRFIYNVKFKTHITPYLKLSHFLPIKYRIKFKACMIGYKIYNCHAPQYLIEDFTKFIPTTERILREGVGRDRFMFNVYYNEIHANKVLNSLIKRDWNSLPIIIRSCNTLETFKTKLKTYFYALAYPAEP